MTPHQYRRAIRDLGWTIYNAGDRIGYKQPWYTVRSSTRYARIGGSFRFDKTYPPAPESCACLGLCAYFYYSIAKVGI